jgi:hypothetical protein
MYPMNLCEIMRDLVMPRCCFCYVSLDLVMFRCLCCFGYVLIVGYVLCIISMILYYIKDITYDLIGFY